MPIYEFQCGGCGSIFSRLSRSLTADLSGACPHCGATDTQRRVTGFAVHRSIKTQIEQLDPRIEKELDAADNIKKAVLDGSSPPS